MTWIGMIDRLFDSVVIAQGRECIHHRPITGSKSIPEMVLMSGTVNNN